MCASITSADLQDVIDQINDNGEDGESWDMTSWSKLLNEAVPESAELEPEPEPEVVPVEVESPQSVRVKQELIRCEKCDKLAPGYVYKNGTISDRFCSIGCSRSFSRMMRKANERGQQMKCFGCDCSDSLIFVRCCMAVCQRSYCSACVDSNANMAGYADSFMKDKSEKLNYKCFHCDPTVRFVALDGTECDPSTNPNTNQPKPAHTPKKRTIQARTPGVSPNNPRHLKTKPRSEKGNDQELTPVEMLSALSVQMTEIQKTIKNLESVFGQSEV